VFSSTVVLVMAVIFVWCGSWLKREPCATYGENNAAESPGTSWSVMVLALLYIRDYDAPEKLMLILTAIHLDLLTV
jgi:hypothetical protein